MDLETKKLSPMPELPDNQNQSAPSSFKCNWSTEITSTTLRPIPVGDSITDESDKGSSDTIEEDLEYAWLNHF